MQPPGLLPAGMDPDNFSFDPRVVIADTALAVCHDGTLPSHTTEVVTLPFRDPDLASEDLARAARAARNNPPALDGELDQGSGAEPGGAAAGAPDESPPLLDPGMDVYAAGMICHEMCGALPLRAAKSVRGDPTAKLEHVARGVALATGRPRAPGNAPRAIRLLGDYMTAPDRARRPTARMAARLSSELLGEYLVGRALMAAAGVLTAERERSGCGIVSLAEVAVLAASAQQRGSAAESADDECVRQATMCAQGEALSHLVAGTLFMGDMNAGAAPRTAAACNAAHAVPAWPSPEMITRRDQLALSPDVTEKLRVITKDVAPTLLPPAVCNDAATEDPCRGAGEGVAPGGARGDAGQAAHEVRVEADAKPRDGLLRRLARALGGVPRRAAGRWGRGGKKARASGVYVTCPSNTSVRSLLRMHMRAL